jgi:hypothetical protein
LWRYESLLHDVILFDEAACHLVLRCKKLFQASLSTVIMASSCTNCHSYQVWVYCKQLIVFPNRWSLDLAQLPHPDREWIPANSVHAALASPLWIDE